MKDCLKVSVAMCTYNGEQYVEEQLRSILSQTRKVDEIVIGDDGSEDGTIEAVKRALTGSTVSQKIIRNRKNLGYRKNFENVIRHTTGDVIFLCDQDDVWLTEKVETMTAVMESDPTCLMAFSDAYVTNASLQVQKGSQWDAACYTENHARFPDMMDLLLSGYYVTGAASCIRRELFDRCSNFSEVWIHDGWLAVHAAFYGTLTPVEKKLIYYRQHGNNQIGARADVNPLVWAGNKMEVVRGGAEKQLALHRDSRDRWKEFYDLHHMELSDARKKQMQNAICVHSDLYRLPQVPLSKRLEIIQGYWEDGSYMAFYRKGRSCMLADLLFLTGMKADGVKVDSEGSGKETRS